MKVNGRAAASRLPQQARAGASVDGASVDDSQGRWVGFIRSALTRFLAGGKLDTL